MKHSHLTFMVALLTAAVLLLIFGFRSDKGEIFSQSEVSILQPFQHGSGPVPESKDAAEASTAVAGEGGKVEKDGSQTKAKPLFSMIGKTTGRPLVPGSADVVQARLAGRTPVGRVTVLERAPLETFLTFKPGARVNLPLTDRESIPGTVHFVTSPAAGVVSVIGGLSDRKGSFTYEQEAGKVRGSIMLLKEKLAYRFFEGENGVLELQEVLLDEVLCVPSDAVVQADTSGLKAEKLVTGTGGVRGYEAPLRASEPAPIMNSRPSATIQFYLNFNGETVSGTSWNSSYNGGNPIVAAAAGLTAAQITQVFNEVAEYYRPFNVNVTTDPVKYSGALSFNRMKCVVTTTNTAGGADELTLGIAGVGVFGSFNANLLCWAFTHNVNSIRYESPPGNLITAPMINGLDGIAAAIAHELGHTLGLNHDGLLFIPPSTPAKGYFEGHGQGLVNMIPAGASAEYNDRWGPIMGSPMRIKPVIVSGALSYFRKTADIVQWSKGEYNYANRNENDLAIIAGNLGYTPDEAGNTTGTAATLSVTGTSVNHTGIITEETDVDCFRFATTGGTAVINVTAKKPMLNVLLEILDINGTVLETANPYPSVDASITRTLAAGLYYVRIEGAGEGDAASTGYSKYGSIGEYTITGTIPGWLSHPGYAYDLQMTNPFGGNVVKIAKQASSSSDFAAITTAETGHVNFGFGNFGAATINPNSFSIGITRDGVTVPTLRNNSTIPPFGSISEYNFASPLGQLPAGSHKIVVTLDKDGEITEHDETNNSAVRWFNVIAVSGTPADLAPVRNTGWDDRMVISTVTGTNTDAPAFSSLQNVYVDFAWSNFGPTGTGSDFTVTLKLDGVVKVHQTSPALASLTGTSLLDCNLGKLTAGSHTLEMFVDSGFAITEGNESNNVYSRTFTVLQGVTVPTVSSPTGSWTATTGSFGGTVVSDGGSPITARGILLSTNPFPSVSDPTVLKELSPGTTGVFTGVSFTGLVPNTLYYGSVFASNVIGTNYVDFSFTTPPLPLPVISGLNGTRGRTTATYSANVTSDSGATILERGILIAATATNPNPLLNGTGVTKVTSAGTTGVFTCQFTSLTPNTAYTVKAYATNSSGTAYTSVVNFTTLQTEPPTVISPTSASITSTSAMLGGNITSDGGVSVSGRGVIYSQTAVNADPQFGGTGVELVSSGTSGTGVFTMNVTGLLPGTSYTFRPYGTGSAGTGFSAAAGTFTTLASVPVVTTPTSAAVTASGATLGGNVISTGGVAITAVGVVYAPTSVNANPQLDGVGVSQVSAAGSTGVFTRNVTGLAPGTPYSYAAFATSSLGTGYSSVGTITTVQTLPPYSLAVTTITEGKAAGNDSVVLVTASPSATWTATANNSWLHIMAGSSSGTGSANVSFSFDDNYGATRVGTLTIAGQTLTVTQAGAEYTKVAFQPVILFSGGLSSPSSVAMDVSGNVYIADTHNHAIKKWTASTQTVSTLVSSGLLYPYGVAVDGFGNVYIADTLNSAVKKWTAATQTMTTLAAKTYDNYDNPALNVNTPEAVAVDAAGNVYIADTQNNMIKKWTASTQVLSTLVSTGLSGPKGVAVDAAGNVYISDTYNHALKKWSAATQTVSTLPTSGFLYSPRSVAVDGSGNVYVASGGTGDILKWTAATQTTAQMAFPLYADGVAVDPIGNVVFTDSYFSRIEHAPRAFVNATAQTAPAAASSGVLPVVLPTTVNLNPPFRPNSSQGWLTIGSASNGLVNYSFTLNNTGAPRAAQINLLGQSITVTQDFIAAPSGLTYTNNSPTYIQGVSITANSPSSTGGAISSYSVSPALPSGLSLDTATGVITGTPTAVTAQATYTVTATNITGSTQRNLLITITPPAPAQPVYPVNPAVYTKGVPITVNTPSSTGGGTPTSWTLTGTLPVGLSFSTSTGAISGTPTALAGITSYAVTANNATGASPPTNLVLTVNDVAPSALSYTNNSPVYARGVAITPNSPGNSGGAVVSYTVSPDLPPGLNLDRDSGVITGTPLDEMAQTAYTVTAVNSGGSTTRVLTITIISLPPVVAEVSPAAGSTAGGTSVTITGSNFSGASSVTFGGIGAAAFTVVNTTIITATTPAHPAGAVNVVVTTPSGSSTGGLSLFAFVTPNTAPGFTLPAGTMGAPGETWVARQANRFWSGIAASLDGMKQVAVTFNNFIYTSTDAGATWIAREDQRGWNAVASSSDGTKLCAVDWGGRIYTSTDSGITWTARASNRNWDGIASSEDGTMLAASAYNDRIYVSTDSGVSWTAVESVRGWSNITSSADGQKLAAVVDGGLIYISADAGQTWTPQASALSWQSITSSADGTRLAAAAFGGQIHTSDDSGVTWTARDSTRNWRCITSSASGAVLAAGVFNGQVFISSDYGVTWTATQSSRSWITIGLSGDGSRLTAGVNNGQLYTSEGMTLPYTMLVPAGGGSQTSPNFATNISPGLPSEFGQTVSFAVSNNNPDLFEVQPGISHDGTLSFTPGTIPGTALVSVTASDNGGTAFGGSDTSATQSFLITLTETTVPTVALPAVSDITTISARLGGSVTSDGGLAITERGVIYAQTLWNPDPELNGFGVSDPVLAAGSTGVFSVDVTDLTPGTNYTFKAYAKNSNGTSYSSAVSFSTLDDNPDLTELSLIDHSGPEGSYSGPSYALVPGFNTAVYEYTATLPSIFDQVSVNVGKLRLGTSVTVQDIPVPGLDTTFSAAKSLPVMLNAGVNTITVVSTAEDGITTKTFTLTVTRTQPPVVTLGSVPVSDITTTSAELSGNIVSTGFSDLQDGGILIAPTTVNSNPKLSGAGVLKFQHPAEGEFSVPVSGLTPGVQYSFVAYAVNGDTDSTRYSAVSTFTTISNDARLSNLELSAGGFSPDFDGNLFYQHASVPKNSQQITITATAANANASIKIDNVPVVSGEPGDPLTLAFGSNLIQITVLAQDGFTSRNYLIYIVRRNVPELELVNATAFTEGEASVEGVLVDNGNATVTARGFLYALTSVNSNPRFIEDQLYWPAAGVTDVPGMGNTANFWATLSDLLPGRSYSYVAYAENSEGIGYSTTGTFTTLTPEIEVSGNGVNISNGDSTPSADDHTDFGSVLVSGGTVTRTFTIRNTGSDYLDLTGSGQDLVTISGSAAFSVTAQPDSNRIDFDGGSHTFTITFDPSTPGAHTAVVSIANDDPDKNPFTFSIAGVGQANEAPSVAVDGVAVAQSSIAALNTARHSMSLTRLGNGKVLAAGGFLSSSRLASAELFDPATGLWTATGSFSNARYLHTASLLPDGKVLIAGGNSNSISRAAELYNPATGTWSNTGIMAVLRDRHTASPLPDGRVLVVGGNVSSSPTATAEIYNPSTQQWSGAASLWVPRSNHSATVLMDGKILVTGGYTTGFSILNSAEIYDPSTGLWSNAAGLSQARHLHTSTRMNDGRVLIAGGQGTSQPFNSVEIYDPISNTWTSASPLGTERQDHKAELLVNGGVVVVGGRKSGGIYLASAEVYDPLTGSWSTIPSLPSARFNHAICQLNDGSLLVAGGYDGSSSLSSGVLYAPTTITLSTAEGTAPTQTGTFSDPDGNATVTLSASSGTVNQNNAAGTWSWSPDAGFDGPSSQTIVITATDSPGAMVSANFTFTVTNALPVPTIQAPSVAGVGALVSFTFTAADASVADQAAGFSWQLNFGDGTVENVAAGIASPLARTHAFSQAGTYQVTMTATDKDGGTSTLASKSITISSSSNAELASLTLSAGSLSPAFVSALTDYTTSLSYATSSLKLTAVSVQPAATLQLRLNGAPYAALASGAPSADLPLNVGANTIQILSTAPDGVTTKSYSVTVLRESEALSSWKVAFFGGNTTNTAPEEDFDGDGTPNILEFAFGLNPADAAKGALVFNGNFSGGDTIVPLGEPVVGIQNIGQTQVKWAVFVRRKDYVSAHLSYQPRFSHDLTNWQDSMTEPTVLADDGINQLVAVPYPAMLANGQLPKFFVISVTLLP